MNVINKFLKKLPKFIQRNKLYVVILINIHIENVNNADTRELKYNVLDIGLSLKKSDIQFKRQT